MNSEPPTTNSFVSRGGLKLQAALDQFQVDPTDKICLDVGASTGGFTDCLLQDGASKVYAVDTCYGELAWKLRQDPRVIVMERTNILHLPKLPEQVDLIVIDAGWTRLELILPIVAPFLKPGGQIIALLKPHYEADKRDLVKGVLPLEKAEEIKYHIIQTINHLPFTINQTIDSPILGGGGNKEFLLLISPRLRE